METFTVVGGGWVAEVHVQQQGKGRYAAVRMLEGGACAHSALLCIVADLEDAMAGVSRAQVRIESDNAGRPRFWVEDYSEALGRNLALCGAAVQRAVRS